jgi:hypothetical protein
MRIYIIGNDGITLCREPPTAVNEGEIAVSALLQPVYDRFIEGFDTADLKAAKALLDALR